MVGKHTPQESKPTLNSVVFYKIPLCFRDLESTIPAGGGGRESYQNDLESGLGMSK